MSFSWLFLRELSLNCLSHPRGQAQNPSMSYALKVRTIAQKADVDEHSSGLERNWVDGKELIRLTLRHGPDVPLWKLRRDCVLSHETPTEQYAIIRTDLLDVRKASVW